MSIQDHHHQFMRRALQLAAERRGFCAPNPAVGAVVVKAGKIIGEGMHWACGHPHAEVMALQSLSEKAVGATLYVTLEPCSHYGKTPPCTDLLIRSGVSEVFFGMQDPNPRVSGGGAAVLQKAGVSCQLLPDPEIEKFYQSYCYWLSRGLPWVTIKLAISLDGKIAGLHGAPVRITGPECQRYTHQQRLRSDAILTTVATIIADDPQLNIRLANEVIAKPLYILDSQLRLPLTAQIFRTAKSLTIFHDRHAPAEKRAQLQTANVKCIAVSTDNEGLRLPEILALIGADGCHDLWVEAGGRSFHSFLSANLAQTALIYVAPKILGPEATPAFTHPESWSPPPAHTTWTQCGADVIARIDLS
jgi:diaminohydroxyphosphoribosylaminopyrimidine deaminase / 5-amino-6-(5-phosphoribosylamino)uracil reductase